MAKERYQIMLEDELKADLKAILSSEQLNIHLLNLCLELNEDETKKIIVADKTIGNRIEKLFEDPNGYWIQDNICKNGLLSDVLDTDKKFQQMLGNLEKLPGKEIVRIFRTASEDTQEAKRTEFFKTVLKSYRQQTAKLHDYCEYDGDVMYTEMGDKESCKYWDGYRKTLLDIVGMYKDNPAVEKLAEEKVARIFSYFMFPRETLDGSLKQQKICYASTKGGEEYARRMISNFIQDKDSAIFNFYIEHAREVFTRVGSRELLAKTVSKMIPLLTHEDTKVGGELVDILGDMRKKEPDHNFRELLKTVKEKILENPFSELSRMFMGKGEKLFDGAYGALARDLIVKYKDEHPDFCSQMCKKLIEFCDNIKSPWSADIALADVYMIYRTAELKQCLERMVNRKSVVGYKILEYAEYAEKTGMECYADLLDKAIKEKKFGSELDLSGFKKSCKYKMLFERIENAHIKELIIAAEDNKCVFDCNMVTGNVSLKEIKADTRGTRSLDEVEFINPEVLLKLPALENISIRTNDEGRDNLYNALMQNKPKKLAFVNVNFTVEQAFNLMKKYPDFTAECVDNAKLREIVAHHKKIAAAEKQDNPLLYAVENDILFDCLSVLPKNKLPKIEDFMKTDDDGNSAFMLLHEQGKKGKADLLKAGELLGIKKDIELLIAVADNNLVKYLQNLKQEELPSLKTFYNGDLNILGMIKDGARNKKNYTETVIEVFKILCPDEKGIAELVKNTKDEGLTEAVAQWHTKQVMDKGEAAAQAAFKAWQESKGKIK